VYDLEKSTDIDDIGNYLTSHLKMGGGYWSLTSLSVMKEELTEKKKDSIMEWLYECQNEDGGFGGNIGHDSHITSSHYSLLISIVLDRLE
jgi:geranylgeranyl transferase type-2 subunit beta